MSPPSSATSRTPSSTPRPSTARTRRSSPGSLPAGGSTSPSGGSGWADCGVILPWTVWQMTGDADIVERSWPAMARYLDWIQQQTGDTYAGQGSLTGDWLAPQKTSAQLMSDVYYGYVARLMAQMARATGRADGGRGVRAALRPHQAGVHRQVPEHRGRPAHGEVQPRGRLTRSNRAPTPTRRPRTTARPRCCGSSSSASTRPKRSVARSSGCWPTTSATTRPTRRPTRTAAGSGTPRTRCPSGSSA